MTFTIRTRGAGAWLLCEYRCPECGVFELLVQRDENGDAPDYADCPTLIPRNRGAARCDLWCPWTVSAPHPKAATVVPYATVRGGDMTDRPSGMLDTRDLADGKVTYTEWKKKQRDAQVTRRHKELIDKGVTSRKVIVG